MLAGGQGQGRERQPSSLHFHLSLPVQALASWRKDELVGRGPCLIVILGTLPSSSTSSDGNGNGKGTGWRSYSPSSHFLSNKDETFPQAAAFEGVLDLGPDQADDNDG